MELIEADDCFGKFQALHLRKFYMGNILPSLFGWIFRWREKV